MVIGGATIACIFSWKKMSAFVNVRVFRNFPQFLSFRQISNYPTLLNKETDVKNVEGNLFKIK